MYQLFSRGVYIGAFPTFDTAFEGLEKREYEEASIAEIDGQKLVFVADLSAESELHVRYSHATRITTFYWRFISSGNRVIVDTKVERFGIIDGVGKWLEGVEDNLDEYQKIEICGILNKWSDEYFIEIEGEIFYISLKNKLPDIYTGQKVTIVGKCQSLQCITFIAPITYRVEGGKWQVNEH